MIHQIKYTKLLIFGICSNFLLLSCNKGETDNKTIEIYNYNNKIDGSIKIKTWKQNILKEYIIDSNKSLKNKIILSDAVQCSVNDVVSTNSDCILFHSDSIKVIFKNLKYLKFKRGSNSNRNILNQESYVYENINNEKIFNYNFTEEDYNNAIDCNGNCD